MSAASHRKNGNKELIYNTLFPHPRTFSISAIWDISRAINSLLKQNYSLEVTLTCPQPNGSQTSEAEKTDYQNLSFENILKSLH